MWYLRGTILIAGALGLLVAGLWGMLAAGAAPQSDAVGSYVVVLKDGVESEAVAREHASAHAAAVSHVYGHALKGYAARIPVDRLVRIMADSRVDFVSADREVRALGVVSTGGAGSSQPAVAADQVAPTGVMRIGASSNGVSQTLTNKGAGVNVAVIDTGIQLAHPDLSPVTSGKTCIRGTKNANDDNGHGTHVAGSIAARDNTIGVVGVAPEATLYAVKVLSRNGSGTWSSVICGVDWVTGTWKDDSAGNEIAVANMSLGGSGSSKPSNADCTNSNNDALHKAICNSVKAGVTYVVAAGNSAADSTGFVPAAYEEVITVSALADFNGAPGGGAAPTCRSDIDDTFANFSNYGAPVDIAAPGVCIASTWIGGAYNTISGTSMASPHVAGAAGLHKAANPGASPADVRAALIATWEPGPIPEDPDIYKEGVVHVF